MVVLESTTYPGTTRERLAPLLEESGLAAGPRLQPGLLAGADRPRAAPTSRCATRRRWWAASRRRAAPARWTSTSEVCDEVVEVSGPEAAELSKLLENVFRSVNIALVNELAMLCERMGIDVWEVVEAAATKPYGFMPFSPGPGMGGHCLPVDPFYLAWKAREYGQPTEFVELAGEVNQRMPEFCVELIAQALNDHSKAVRGSRVAILGVSYKPGVGDLRESPALKIMRMLDERGAELAYHDDFVPELAVLRARQRSAGRGAGGRGLRGDRDRPPGPGRRGRGGRRALGGRSARRHARYRVDARGAAVKEPARVRGRGRRPRLLGPQPGPQLRPAARRRADVDL
ncbi:MAG: nucleotide sugar dehydrogenase [Thermoleophilaceae bacterium]